MIVNNIVLKIKKECKKRKLSINQLALRSGIRQSTLSSIMNGDSKNPSIIILSKICEGLSITLNEFFSDELFTN